MKKNLNKRTFSKLEAEEEDPNIEIEVCGEATNAPKPTKKQRTIESKDDKIEES